MTEKTVKPPKIIKGVLTFHSETGTEGGVWALQDEKHISYRPGNRFLQEGSTVFDPANHGRRGKVLRTWKADGRPLPDPSVSVKFDAWRASLKRKPNFNTAITKYFKLVAAGYQADPDEDITVEVKWPRGKTERRLASTVHEVHWEYAGLHYLGNGDQLTIFSRSKPRKVIWSGTIELIQHELFTEGVFGMWIHADMKGWNREKWARLFFNEHPAELIKYKRSR